MKKTCPSCDSTQGIREILYGLPEYPVDESKFYLGGCCVASSLPTWICIQCDYAPSSSSEIDY